MKPEPGAEQSVEFAIPAEARDREIDRQEQGDRQGQAQIVGHQEEHQLGHDAQPAPPADHQIENPQHALDQHDQERNAQGRQKGPGDLG